MEKSLFNKNGNAVAYIAEDLQHSIYLWEGYPVAYLYNDRHIYGFNGRHLGWMIDDIIYDYDGLRTGFTYSTCPVSPEKEVIKPKKYPKSEIQARWKALSLPKLTFQLSDTDLADFLKEGEPYNPRKEALKEKSEEEN